MLNSVQNIVVLTGAGMSAESGVPTFRGQGGLWEGHRIDEVASPEAFAQNPELVHRFYNLRRAALRAVEPNAGHFALARLENEWAGNLLVVTQNVDDLHERAGSQKLVHMHGELRKARCESCQTIAPWFEDLDASTACPSCRKRGGMRPHIVWFGEIPFEMEVIIAALNRADLFLCIGTSGLVYPAAGFAHQAAQRKECRLIELNIDQKIGLIGASTLRAFRAYAPKLARRRWRRKSSLIAPRKSLPRMLSCTLLSARAAFKA